MIRALRGATTIDSDCKEQISSRTTELFSAVLSANKLTVKSVVSVIISTTADITAYYPATALRLSGVNVPLLSTLEPKIDSPLNIPLCVRILVTVRGGKNNHVYLHGAKNLLAQSEV